MSSMLYYIIGTVKIYNTYIINILFTIYLVSSGCVTGAGDRQERCPVVAWHPGGTHPGDGRSVTRHRGPGREPGAASGAYAGSAQGNARRTCGGFCVYPEAPRFHGGCPASSSACCSPGRPPRQRTWGRRPWRPRHGHRSYQRRQRRPLLHPTHPKPLPRMSQCPACGRSLGRDLVRRGRDLGHNPGRNRGCDE